MDDSISVLSPFSLLPPTARPTHSASVAALRTMLTNSVPSGHTRRAYAKAFDDLLALVARTGQPISRQLFQQYRAEMVDAGLGGSTINVRLSGVRKLVNEARENGLVDPSDAERIVSVPNVPAQGVRLGQWLTVEQTRDLLAVPNRSQLKGKRSYGILSVLTQSALRREEASRLDMSHLQMREGRWVLADIRGKRGRVRTVALPASAKAAIDEWTRGGRHHIRPCVSPTDQKRSRFAGKRPRSLGDLGRGGHFGQSHRHRRLRPARRPPQLREVVPQEGRATRADPVHAGPRVDRDDRDLHRLRAGDRRSGQRQPGSLTRP